MSEEKGIYITLNENDTNHDAQEITQFLSNALFIRDHDLEAWVILRDGVAEGADMIENAPDAMRA